MIESTTESLPSAQPSRVIQTLVLFFAGITAGILITTIYYYTRSDPDAHLRGDVRQIQPQVNSLNQYELAIDQPLSVPQSEEKLQAQAPLPVATPEPNDIALAPSSEPAKKEKGRYLLQVVSLRNAKRANQLRAELALNGIEAKVVKVSVKDIGDHYRIVTQRADQPDELKRLSQRIETIFPNLKPLIIRVD